MFTLTITAEQFDFMQSFLRNAKMTGAYNLSTEENANIDAWLKSLQTATGV